MTVNPSDERALRLPRDFALIAVGLDVAMFVISTVVLLTRFTPDVEQIRSAYAQPEVWITMLAGLAVPWTLAALLGWSHARHALERLGVAKVALAHDARLRFGTVWALVVAFSYYGLTPLFFKIRTLFMAGGRFEEFSGYSPYLGMGAAMLLQSVVQLAVLVLGLWLAARLALSRSRGQDVAVRAPEDAALQVAGAPPRRAVAWLIAAVFASMQLWSSLAVSNWLFPSDDNTLRLLLTLVLPWLAAFALAFWGAWLGTRAGMSAGAAVQGRGRVRVGLRAGAGDGPRHRDRVVLTCIRELLAHLEHAREHRPHRGARAGLCGAGGGDHARHHAPALPPLLVAARVLDHLAVVRQRARRHQLDGAAQLGHLAHGIGNARIEPGRRAGAFEPEGHLVVAHLARHHEARALDLRKSPCNLRHLRRMHEHAAHLGGLVGAAEPALDALVGAARWGRCPRARPRGRRCRSAPAGSRG
jgi:hypothetical protein